MTADEHEPRTVSVVGEGRAASTPDVATLQLGVETTDATLTMAQADNSRRSTALRARLRELGVEARDMQTFGYNVGQDHGLEGPIGYRVSNMVRITIRALDRVGTLLDAAIEAGANRVHHVGFRVARRSRGTAAGARGGDGRRPHQSRALRRPRRDKARGGPGNRRGWRNTPDIRPRRRADEGDDERHPDRSRREYDYGRHSRYVRNLAG